MAQEQIAANDRRDELTAIAAQTDFLFTFPVDIEGDLLVTQMLAIDGSVDHPAFTSVLTATGGTITLDVAASAGDRITIEGNRTIDRGSNYLVGGEFNANDVNFDMNTLTKFVQDLRRDVDRCIGLSPESLSSIIVKLANPTTVEDQYALVWDDASKSFQLIKSPPAGPTGATGPAGADGADGADGVTEHGLLTGLGDDDHTQYFLVNASRAITGGVTMESTLLVAEVARYGPEVVLTADASIALNIETAPFTKLTATTNSMTVTITPGASKGGVPRMLFIQNATTARTLTFVVAGGDFSWVNGVTPDFSSLSSVWRITFDSYNGVDITASAEEFPQ